MTEKERLYYEHVAQTHIKAGKKTIPIKPGDLFSSDYGGLIHRFCENGEFVTTIPTVKMPTPENDPEFQFHKEMGRQKRNITNTFKARIKETVHHGMESGFSLLHILNKIEAAFDSVEVYHPVPIMNEIEEAREHLSDNDYHYGWICPKCHKAISPDVDVCLCHKVEEKYHPPKKYHDPSCSIFENPGLCDCGRAKYFCEKTYNKD